MRGVAGLVGVLFLLGAAPLAAVERAAWSAALHSISAADLRSHVDVLADDAFEGREAGSRGGRAAGTYLIQAFQRFGLQGAATDAGHVQVFGNGYRNILGLLAGRDATLSQEVILVGAHYDHVGYGNRGNSFGPFGYVHNGADDNASGVAGLLEVVEAMRMLPEPPRRSILFALWDGEEKGLLGSTHWTESPTLPLAKLMFAVNVDMIGRLTDRRLEVFGTRSAAGMRRLLSERNSETDLLLDFSWELKSNSDHYPFFARRLPVLMFHTGLHDDYHRPSDDAHLVNVDGMQHVSRLLFEVVYELAESESIPRFREAARHESPPDQRALERRLAPQPPRLGVRWREETTAEGPGLRLSHVEPGSAAGRAGLQAGDLLVGLDGQAVGDSQAFRLHVLQATSPVEVQVVRGTAAPHSFLVQLEGSPSRIGVSWRDDDAEPGTVVVSRVIPGSPAQLAGLEAGDRICAVSNESFENTDQLIALLRGLPGPLDLLIERQGQMRVITLEVPDAPMQSVSEGS
jgi:hypothetical protein